MNSRLVVISYHFPPIFTAGVLRVTGFIKHLSRLGWDVSVITVKNDSFYTRDPRTLERIPESVRVIRARSFEADLIAGRFIGAAAPGDGEGEPSEADSPTQARRLRPAMVRWARETALRLYNVFRFPDRHIGWFVPLLVAGMKEIRRGGTVTFLTSSPPHSTHLPMLVLKRVSRSRWIADFRDSWTAPTHRPREGMSGRIERWLERRVLLDADHIIANTEGNRRHLLQAFHGLSADKITVITNGFDTDERVDNGQVPDDFTDSDIVYTGDVYPGMMDVLVPALSLIKETTPDRVPSVNFFGYLDPEDRRELDRLGLNECVRFKGLITWEQSLEVMRRATALLLLLAHKDDARSWVPSKLYPYLFSGRPVLAIVPEGDASRIIRETGAGRAITTSNPNDVAREMIAFIDEARKESGERDGEDRRLEPYNMKYLAQQLDALLRRVSEEA